MKKEGSKLYVENAEKRLDVLVIGFSLGSDYASAVAWSGKEYFMPKKWWY